MVKRQRRMTKKKSTVKKMTKKSAKPSKGKQLVRSAKQRPAAKTDRATKAAKKLMKSIQKKRASR